MRGTQAKEIRAPGAAGGIHRPRDGPRKPPHAAVQTGPVGPRIGAVGARHVVAASGRQMHGFAGGQIGTGAGASRTPTWTLLGRRPRLRDRQAMTPPACAALDGDPGVRGGRTDAPAERRPDKGTAACGCPGLPPTPCSIAHGPIMRQWSHEHASSWTWRASLRPVRQAGDRQISARPYRVSARSRTSLPARTRA